MLQTYKKHNDVSVSAQTTENIAQMFINNVEQACVGVVKQEDGGVRGTIYRGND